MMNRNSIVEKIRALLSKTTERGCTEAEMLAALDKARAMMDAYDVSDADLQLAKDEAAVLHAESDPHDAHGIKWQLSCEVGRFCNVQVYRKSREPGLKFIGMPSDVAFAVWLLDTLADHVFTELYGHLIGCCAPRSERRVIIRSFVEGACERISERLAELTTRSEKARTIKGRELVVIKDTAIKTFMEEQGIRLRTYSGHASSNINEAARAAGGAAGNRASFGRPVNGSTGALRIGRTRNDTRTSRGR
jgi:Protein of unknown function (DUF2786)